MLPRFSFVTIIACALFIFLTVYITLPTDRFGGQNIVSLKKGDATKSIVAYSLLKQIEIESEEFVCNKFWDARSVTDKSVDTSTNISNKQDQDKFYNNNITNESVRIEQHWNKVPGTELYVYSIYHDRRLDPYRYLRIIGMTKGTNNESVFCQIRTSDDVYHVTKATQIKIWNKDWNKNDDDLYYNPVLLSCQVPNNNYDVLSVNLSPKPCRIASRTYVVKFPAVSINSSSSAIKICVKPLDFAEDISKRLVQWIEMNRILGADGFEIYVRKVAAKTWRVLQWYRKNFRDFHVNVHKNLHDSGSSERKRIWQKRRNELVPYNDCLYRNLYASQFVIPVDTDEIIVPRRVHTWRHLLDRVFVSATRLLDDFASFTVQNAYYLRQFTKEESPAEEADDIFFFNDLTRSELSVEGESGKSFISTRSALTVFNHYALHVLRPGIYRSYFLPADAVQMNHYKNTCSIELLPECAKYVSSPVRIVDPVILKYKRQFFRNYLKVLEQMNSDSVVL